MWDLLLQEGLSWHPPSPALLWVVQVCSRLALVMGLGRVILSCHVTGAVLVIPSILIFLLALMGRVVSS